MDKKYQIFISSTYTDLRDARNKVIEAILTMYHFPIGMEMFSAGDDDQWTVIQQTIDSSDYYVVIIGHRYGSVTDDGISYTEKEYDYAKQSGIPILAFIRERNVPITEEERERTPELQQKLEKFIEKAKSNKMVSFWTTPDDLATKVTLALYKAFTSHPRPGWIRADEAPSPQLGNELAELSKENRDLRIQLEELKKQLNLNKPKLEVLLNNQTHIELKYNEDLSINPLPIPEKITTIPEHLKEYVNEEDVEEYNKTISEAAEAIQHYNSQLKMQKKLIQNGFEFHINVKNVGSSKANSIYVDIYFPEEILLLDSDEVEELLDLKQPTVPNNPIKKAERKFKQKQMGFNSSLLMGNFDSFPSLAYPSTFSVFNDNRINKLIRSTTPKSAYSWKNEDSNLITVKIGSLIHKRGLTLEEGYVLIPTKPGEYKIKVSIICEEYPEMETFDIPLIVK
jgi:hypothetical protein